MRWSLRRSPTPPAPKCVWISLILQATSGPSWSPSAPTRDSGSPRRHLPRPRGTRPRRRSPTRCADPLHPLAAWSQLVRISLVDNRVGGSFNYARGDSRAALTEPLIAQLLGAKKTEAERGHPGEAGRHRGTVNIAGDQTVGEQPSDRLVELAGSHAKAVARGQRHRLGHYYVVRHSGETGGSQGRRRRVEW